MPESNRRLVVDARGEYVRFPMRCSVSTLQRVQRDCRCRKSRGQISDFLTPVPVKIKGGWAKCVSLFLMRRLDPNY